MCANIPRSHSHLFNDTFKLNTTHKHSLLDFIGTCLSFLVFFFPLFHFWNFSMEFKYRDGQIQRTPSPLQPPLPSNTYVANRPLRGNTCLIFMFLSLVDPFVFLLKNTRLLSLIHSINNLISRVSLHQVVFLAMFWRLEFF